MSLSATSRRHRAYPSDRLARPIVRHSRIRRRRRRPLVSRRRLRLIEDEIWGSGWSGVQISGVEPGAAAQLHPRQQVGGCDLVQPWPRRRATTTSPPMARAACRCARAPRELICNRIFEGSFGVWVYEHGLERFEDNDIVNNAWSGFQVEEGSSRTSSATGCAATARRVSSCTTAAGHVRVERHLVQRARRADQVGFGALLRHNRIHHEKQAGVLTADGTGVLEDNDIFDNQWSGVQTEGRQPLLGIIGSTTTTPSSHTRTARGSSSQITYMATKYGVQSKTGGHDRPSQPFTTRSTASISRKAEAECTRRTHPQHPRLGHLCGSDCSPVLSNNHGVVRSRCSAFVPRRAAVTVAATGCRAADQGLPNPRILCSGASSPCALCARLKPQDAGSPACSRQLGACTRSAKGVYVRVRRALLHLGSRDVELRGLHPCPCL